MNKEELAKFYGMYRLYIFPAAVIVSSLFLIIFAVIPQTLSLINNQKKATALSAKSKFLEDKVLALESYNGSDLSQKTAVALSAFPAEKDFGNILGLLQNLTGRSGFSITAISISDAGSKLDKISSYTVKLQVSGSKVLFQTLLGSLEGSPRLIKVTSIDITSDQTAGSVSASLELAVLYAPAPRDFGTVDFPLPQISQKNEELLTSLAQVGKTVSAGGIVAGSGSSQGISSPKGKSNPFE